jgi:hypothetical protein
VEGMTGTPALFAALGKAQVMYRATSLAPHARGTGPALAELAGVGSLPRVVAKGPTRGDLRLLGVLPA